ncbi:DUF4256 domain-containing protein [Candidatus Dojkabacteria bacterium]|uniref:DUF4256 domain-containing protein n=1 Tax=Candidatus Dojkabacteria bacterium TaxID=2099670 RepID=A0A955RJ30_9BACT|nr:DUF4256 domain-containing protein [Candidatus Dojkabacteria bacterium]
MPKGNGKPIPQVQVDKKISSGLMDTLMNRFQKNMERHEGISWAEVEAKLASNKEAQASLNAMEVTGGEPDVIGYDKSTDSYIFCDCSEQTPERRSICYDELGEEMRNKKGVFPGGNAMGLAKAMGIELLTEDEYYKLQKLGEFDTKTSSWLKTPEDVRKLGGAIYGDRRYDRIFIYHNGAESFYSARGFRGILKV